MPNPGWWGCPLPVASTLPTSHLKLPRHVKLFERPSKLQSSAYIGPTCLNLTILLPHHGGEQDTKHVPRYPAEGGDIRASDWAEFSVCPWKVFTRCIRLASIFWQLCRKEAIRSTIAAMTLGKDVSALFPDLLKNMATSDLDQKKLVYLYLMWVSSYLGELGRYRPDDAQELCKNPPRPLHSCCQYLCAGAFLVDKFDITRSLISTRIRRIQIH